MFTNIVGVTLRYNQKSKSMLEIDESREKIKFYLLAASSSSIPFFIAAVLCASLDESSECGGTLMKETKEQVTSLLSSKRIGDVMTSTISVKKTPEKYIEHLQYKVMPSLDNKGDREILMLIIRTLKK